MTVGEMIEVLSQHPRDMLVILQEPTGEWEDYNPVYQVKEVEFRSGRSSTVVKDSPTPNALLVV